MVVKKTIIIKDNSIGMPGKYVEFCVSIGKKVNEGQQLLSFSAVGLKGAIYSLGKDFEIITKPRSENDMVYQLTPNFTSDDPAEKVSS